MYYKVRTATRYYLKPGESARDYVPVGVVLDILQVQGRWGQISAKDPNPWRAKWVLMAVLDPVEEPPDTPPEEPPEEPPPTPEPVLTHTIEVYSDGSIRIDGKPYP